MTRQEALDSYIEKVISAATDNCNDIETVPCIGGTEYQWWEIRESIMRCLFEADRSQMVAEINAQFVKDNCI